MLKQEVWKCAYCPVRKLTIISDLEGLDLLDFQFNVTKHEMKTGQIIYTEGNDCTGLHVVMRGRVKIYYENAEGKEQIVDILEPGSVFGNISLSPNKKCDVSTVCYENGMYCSIPLDYYQKLVKDKPKIALKLLSVLESKLSKSRKMIRDLSLKRARQRLASIIIQIAEDQNVITNTPNTKEINLPLTIQTLAYMSGLTQETASRVMSEFKKNKIVSLKSRKLKILNYDELLNISKT